MFFWIFHWVELTVVERWITCGMTYSQLPRDCMGLGNGVSERGCEGGPVGPSQHAHPWIGLFAWSPLGKMMVFCPNKDYHHRSFSEEFVPQTRAGSAVPLVQCHHRWGHTHGFGLLSRGCSLTSTDGSILFSTHNDILLFPLSHSGCDFSFGSRWQKKFHCSQNTSGFWIQLLSKRLPLTSFSTQSLSQGSGAKTRTSPPWVSLLLS